MTDDTIRVTFELPAHISAMIMKLTIGIDLITETKGDRKSFTRPDQ